MNGACDAKLPVTAIVVTLNEGRRLRACLSSISFCDELIVCDLGSTDDSVMIAEEFGATVLRRARVPVVEMLWPELFHVGRHDWVLRFDPDEEFPAALVDPVRSIIAAPGKVGCVLLPLQYNFLGKPLSVSVWGGIRYINKLFRRDRVQLTGRVHSGISVVSGFESMTLSDCADAPVAHYWVDSLSQMVEKHRRYLSKEGEARYALGCRFTYRQMAAECLRGAKANLITTRGIFGGWRGIFLAGFHFWYVAGCHLSLRRYQRAVAGDVE